MLNIDYSTNYGQVVSVCNGVRMLVSKSAVGIIANGRIPLSSLIVNSYWLLSDTDVPVVAVAVFNETGLS
jgi:hypothetical protein